MNSPATVQRYELTSHGQYSMRYESLDEDPSGDWVKWEDHCRALEGMREVIEAAELVDRCGNSREIVGPLERLHAALERMRKVNP